MSLPDTEGLVVAEPAAAGDALDPQWIADRRSELEAAGRSGE